MARPVRAGPGRRHVFVGPAKFKNRSGRQTSDRRQYYIAGTARTIQLSYCEQEQSAARTGVGERLLNPAHFFLAIC